ncbi:MAG TPA: hypothetical protein PKN70_09995 [Smithellaceae bacterium]|nr:hypothetical protein [Smithellaceae bacterium]
MSVRICWMKYFFIPWRNSLFWFVVLVNLIPWTAGAAIAEVEISRNVLVLYDSRSGQNPTANVVFRGFQTALNYYGVLTDYRDVNVLPLPDDRQMKKYLGVISACEKINSTAAPFFLTWLAHQFDQGRRVVLLGNLNIEGEISRSMSASREKIYARLGLVHKGGYLVNPSVCRYHYKDAQMVEFERKYPILPPVYEQITISDRSVKSHLMLDRTDRKNSISAMIITGKRGGFAHQGYIFWMTPERVRKLWYLNPFLFMELSLGLSGRPVPDPTTLNGARIGFSHVDADGFGDPSRIGRNQTCAELMRDQIFKRYPFPITSSVIVAEVDPKTAKTKRHAKTAADIFKLPNIEPASHSFSHPFYWSRESLNRHRYDDRLAFRIPGYTFDERAELDGSVAYISRNLSPADKPCRVFLWTGECRPTERQIARLDQLGVFNINGGDTVYDDSEKSLFTVSPLYRQVGARTQFFIGQANDNILTESLSGPLYGYRNIITTMERTDKPRRLKPVNVYYHFFSATKQAQLRAVMDVYEWALKQDLALMFTSEYVRVMQGYMAAKTASSGTRRFTITHYGDCLTMRFPAGTPAPDLVRSENVIGYHRLPQGLFISLLSGSSRAVIVLGDANSRPAGAYIRKATGFVTRFQADKQGIEMKYRGFGDGHLEIGGLEAGKTYRVSGSGMRGGSEIEANGQGVLDVRGVKSGLLEIKRR